MNRPNHSWPRLRLLIGYHCTVQLARLEPRSFSSLRRTTSIKAYPGTFPKAPRFLPSGSTYLDHSQATDSVIDHGSTKRKYQAPELIVPGDLQATLAAHKKANAVEIKTRNPLLAKDSIARRRLALDLLTLKQKRKWRSVNATGKRQGRQVGGELMNAKVNGRSTIRSQKRLRLRRRSHAEQHTPVFGNASDDFEPRGIYSISSDSSPQTPWLQYMEKGGDSSRLYSEMNAVQNWMRPTKYEWAGRARVIDDILRLIKATVSEAEATVTVIGSTKNGLCRATSDVDLYLFLPRYAKEMGSRGPSPSRPQILKEARKQLLRIQNALDASTDYEQAELREGQISLLSVTHQTSGLEVQIQASAVRENAISREYVKDYLARYPALGPTYHTVKTMLDIHGLSETFSGGIGSYSLFMLLASFYRLKARHTPRIGAQVEDPLTTGLLGALHFLTKELDFNRDCLSLEPPEIFPKRSLDSTLSLAQKELGVRNMVLRGRQSLSVVKGFRPHLLCLQDPADPFQDLGRKCTRIDDVLTLFARTYDQIADSLKTFRPRPLGPLRAERSVFEVALGANYDVLERKRAQLGDFGESLSPTGMLV